MKKNQSVSNKASRFNNFKNKVKIEKNLPSSLGNTISFQIHIKFQAKLVTFDDLNACFEATMFLVKFNMEKRARKFPVCG